jgi:hypothetical protein
MTGAKGSCFQGKYGPQLLARVGLTLSAGWDRQKGQPKPHQYKSGYLSYTYGR